MKDQDKTRERLIDELVKLRRRIADLEGSQTNRTLAFEAIRESEMKYKDLIENIQDIVYIVDDKGKIKFISKVWEESTGYLKEECIDKYFSDFIVPESYQNAIDIFKRQLKGEDAGVFELQFYNKNGEILTIETLEKLVWKGDRIVEVHGIGRDITKRKRDEELLRSSEEKYRTILENIDDGYFEVDITGSFTFFNDSMCRILGYSRDEMLGINNRKYMNLDTAKDVFRVFNEVFRTKKARRSFDWELISKDKNKIFVSTSVTPVFDNKENVVGFRGIARDITEKRRSEEALRESEEKFRNLFESSMDTIYLSSVEGKFIDINPAGEGLLGYSVDELLELDIIEIYMNNEDRKRFQKTIEEEGSVRDYEITLKKKDGTLIDCLVTATIRSNDDGNMIGYQGIIRDISEKKRLEGQLIAAQKMEAIGTLAGGIAHDFNNILSTILGYSSYLKSKVPEGDTTLHQGLEVIENSSVRASELTSQLLAYSRRGKLEVRKINMNRIINSIYQLISKTFEKSIEIAIETEMGLKSVEGDESQLNQVVMNLAINSKDAMPRGGKLKIKTYSENGFEGITMDDFTIEPGDYACLVVTDTGIGMDEETRRRVFDPYFTTRKEKGGTGLGMSMVYGIVKGHNGYINIQSAPEEGTEVMIYLPAVGGSEDVSEMIIGEVRGKSESILVIDDEKDILEVVKDILKDANYRVWTSSSGASGLMTFKKKSDSIDLVILDIMMPGMDGKEVLKKMLELEPDLKVLLTSGYSEKDRHHDLLEMGAIGFIEKPFVANRLLLKVGEALK